MRENTTTNHSKDLIAGTKDSIKRGQNGKQCEQGNGGGIARTRRIKEKVNELRPVFRFVPLVYHGPRHDDVKASNDWAKNKVSRIYLEATHQGCFGKRKQDIHVMHHCLVDKARAERNL